MYTKTQGTERDFVRWFVPLTISSEPELKVLETVFFWFGNCQLPKGRGDVLELSFSQHRTTATGGAPISGLSSVIVGRRPRAVLQAAIRWWFYRGLWTHLHHGMLAAGIILFWLQRWYANFEKTFFQEEDFFKVDVRDLAHHELHKAPGSK